MREECERRRRVDVWAGEIGYWACLGHDRQERRWKGKKREGSAASIWDERRVLPGDADCFCCFNKMFNSLLIEYTCMRCDGVTAMSEKEQTAQSRERAEESVQNAVVEGAVKCARRRGRGGGVLESRERA